MGVGKGPFPISPNGPKASGFLAPVPQRIVFFTMGHSA
jgi:hypothetical protein